MSTAKKSDPQLWETVKDEMMESDKGGAPGQWSARKAQLAVQEYKRRGGGYDDDGPGQQQTDLNDWTDEDWGTKSGRKSEDSAERYLPKAVRMLLTEDEYRRCRQGCRRKPDGPGPRGLLRRRPVAARHALVGRRRGDGRPDGAHVRKRQDRPGNDHVRGTAAGADQHRQGAASFELVTPVFLGGIHSRRRRRTDSCRHLRQLTGLA